jgi:hypothetical protein
LKVVGTLLDIVRGVPIPIDDRAVDVRDWKEGVAEERRKNLMQVLGTWFSASSNRW